MGAYDTCNLEITQAIVDAAAADQAPAIIMIYPSHTPQAEWPTLVRIIESEVERTRIPVALVLDHAKTLDQIECALELGFSGVMIDASLAAVGSKHRAHPPGSRAGSCARCLGRGRAGACGPGSGYLQRRSAAGSSDTRRRSRALCEGDRRGRARRLDRYAARAVSRQTPA